MINARTCLQLLFVEIEWLPSTRRLPYCVVFLPYKVGDIARAGISECKLCFCVEGRSNTRTATSGEQIHRCWNIQSHDENAHTSRTTAIYRTRRIPGVCILSGIEQFFCEESCQYRKPHQTHVILIYDYTRTQGWHTRAFHNRIF
jgi:hypothetical protein